MRLSACLAALAIVAATALPATAKIEKFVGVRTEMVKVDGATSTCASAARDLRS